MTNVTELPQVKASAVPAVPRTITATQRLAALNLAREIADYKPDPMFGQYGRRLMRDATSLLNELAGDAKGER